MRGIAVRFCSTCKHPHRLEQFTGRRKNCDNALERARRRQQASRQRSSKRTAPDTAERPDTDAERSMAASHLPSSLPFAPLDPSHMPPPEILQQQHQSPPQQQSGFVPPLHPSAAPAPNVLPPPTVAPLGVPVPPATMASAAQAGMVPPPPGFDAHHSKEPQGVNPEEPHLQQQQQYERYYSGSDDEAANASDGTLDEDDPAGEGPSTIDTGEHSESRSKENEQLPELHTLHGKLLSSDPSFLPSNVLSELKRWWNAAPQSLMSVMRPGCVEICVDVCLPPTAWLGALPENSCLKQFHWLSVDTKGGNSPCNACKTFCYDNLSGCWPRTKTSGGHQRCTSNTREKLHAYSPQLASVSPACVLPCSDMIAIRGKNLSRTGVFISFRCDGCARDDVPARRDTVCLTSARSLQLPAWGAVLVQAESMCVATRRHSWSIPLVVAPDVEVKEEVRAIEPLLRHCKDLRCRRQLHGFLYLLGQALGGYCLEQTASRLVLPMARQMNMRKAHALVELRTQAVRLPSQRLLSQYLRRILYELWLMHLRQSTREHIGRSLSTNQALCAWSAMPREERALGDANRVTVLPQQCTGILLKE